MEGHIINLKTVGTLILMIGILLLGVGNILYSLNELTELAPNDYILAEFGNPEARDLVRKKETRDRNRPLAIRMMVGGAVVSVVGTFAFIFGWDKAMRKKE